MSPQDPVGEGAFSAPEREPFSPDAPPFNLVVFFRLCLYITRDLHEHLFRRIIQHPDIPRDATWKRLRNAYWQAASALTGRGETATSGAGRGPDSVLDLPVLAQWLAVAADAMQQELESTDWGRELFPGAGPGELGGKELRRLLRLL